MSTSDWPSSPLDAAQRAFTLLVQPPSHVGFDGRGFAGLPDEILPLDKLRDLLLSPATRVEVRDAVWRELVTRARRDSPAWVVAAVGAAMPGLRRIAGMLAAGWRGDTDDLDAELIVGFVARLKTIDLDVPRICGRLIDAGLRAARKARDADSDADEANLISATRLDNATVAQIADKLGIAASTASAWRMKAERRLAAAISAGELAFIPLRPRRRRANTSTNTANGAAVGRLLGANSDGGVLLGTQQQAFGGKTSDRETAGVGAPGLEAQPA